MRLTNDCYLITLRVGSGVGHCYRNVPVWIKESTRRRKYKATAEQVLNHLLPALTGVKGNVSVTVQHGDISESAARTLERLREQQPRG